MQDVTRGSISWKTWWGTERRFTAPGLTLHCLQNACCWRWHLLLRGLRVENLVHLKDAALSFAQHAEAGLVVGVRGHHHHWLALLVLVLLQHGLHPTQHADVACGPKEQSCRAWMDFRLWKRVSPAHLWAPRAARDTSCAAPPPSCTSPAGLCWLHTSHWWPLRSVPREAGEKTNFSPLGKLWRAAGSDVTFAPVSLRRWLRHRKIRRSSGPGSSDWRSLSSWSVKLEGGRSVASASLQRWKTLSYNNKDGGWTFANAVIHIWIKTVESIRLSNYTLKTLCGCWLTEELVLQVLEVLRWAAGGSSDGFLLPLLQVADLLQQLLPQLANFSLVRRNLEFFFKKTFQCSTLSLRQFH